MLQMFVFNLSIFKNKSNLTICLKRLELGNYCFNDAPPTVSC